MKTANMTLTQIAASLGSSDRISREFTLPAHRAFLKADEDTQHQMRRDWLVGYLTGNLNVTAKRAADIADLARDERGEKQQQAYDRARQQFKYHIARPEANDDQTSSVTKAFALIAKDLDKARKIGKSLKGATAISFHSELAALIAKYEV